MNKKPGKISITNNFDWLSGKILLFKFQKQELWLKKKGETIAFEHIFLSKKFVFGFLRWFQ